MKHSRHIPQRLIFAFVVAALLLVPAVSRAQIHPQPPGANGKTQPEGSVWELQQREQMAKKANLQRQQELKKDTEKLLELATELKQYVDKSTENTLSLDVVKKAEQIEKLAKAVKEKMKGQ